MTHLTGVIPAGGFGTRLQPHTLEIPKPLLLMGSAERLMFDSAVELATASCQEVLMTTDYKATMLEDCVGDRYPAVTLLRDRKTIGNAGFLLEHYVKLRELPADGDTLVMPSDHIHENFSIEDFLLFHKSVEADITMLVTPPKAYGEYVRAEGNWARSVEYSPIGPAVSSTGIFMFRNSYLQAWARLQINQGWDGESMSFYHDIVVPAVGDARVATFSLGDGYWDDAGTLHRYFKNNMRLSNGENVISHSANINESTRLEKCVVLGNVCLRDVSIKNAVISQSIRGLHVTPIDSKTELARIG